MLACLGLYGLLAYHVTLRTPELGVRIALGAGRGSVLWLVMRDAFLIVAIGLGVGLPLALIGAQQITRFLYEVAPADVASYSATGALLVAVATLAAWVPARRAASVDPIIALRNE